MNCYNATNQSIINQLLCQVFDGIQTVLFMVACNTFDQVLTSEDSPPVNRLKESIDLFQDVWVSRWVFKNIFKILV